MDANEELELLPAGRQGRWADEDRGRRNFSDVPVTFVTTTDDAIAVINTLGDDVVAMDTETVHVDKVDPYTAQLRVISIATTGPDGNDVSYVFDVKDMDTSALGQAFRDRAAQLGIPRMRMVGFNANFDDPVTTLNLKHWDRDSGRVYRPLFDWADLMFAVSLTRLGAAGNNWWGLAKAADRYLGLELDGKGGVQLSYDADSPLTDDQIRYAANDAIATLWLGDALSVVLDDEGLHEVFTIECGARAFLLGMTIHGLPFDEEGWMAEVAASKQKALELENQLAELTGGQMDLFGARMLSYNPGSPDDVRKLLTEHFPQLVQAHLEDRGDRGQTELRKSDSMDKNVLGLMKQSGKARGLDTTVIDLLLEHSSLAKLDSTYGKRMMSHLGDDGRFHSKFTQCQIETGRTSSSSPNAQNFAPAMKPFFTPPPRVDENGVEHERVILHGDYSQAELRTSAQLTGEPVRVEAFKAGEDQHVAVAEQMFNVDMEALKNGGPEQKARFARHRGSSKTLNFGLAYGMMGAQLALRLTLQGIPTTAQEGTKLIEDFFAALPVEARWLSNRDKFVENIAEAVSYGLERGAPIDFNATFRLYTGKEALKKAASRLPKGKKRDPEALLEEMYPTSGIAASVGQTGAMSAEDRARRLEGIKWALSYDAAVVLRADGTPWEFYSRTIARRRRVFQVPTETLLDELSLRLARPRNLEGEQYVDKWAEGNGIELSTNPHTAGRISPNRRSLSFTDTRKALSADKAKRARFVFDMLSTVRGRTYYPKGRSVPLDMADFLQRAAMAQCVRRLSNAYRNAPIQGTVADAAMLAFTRLNDLLDKYPTAYPVTTVHDSIAIEVDLEDAAEIAPMMKSVMESSLERYVPDVPIVVDLDVLRSLSEDDTVELPTAA